MVVLYFSYNFDVVVQRSKSCLPMLPSQLSTCLFNVVCVNYEVCMNTSVEFMVISRKSTCAIESQAELPILSGNTILTVVVKNTKNLPWLSL